MFDIGFSEIVVIAVVALIVIGPERLPKTARMLGHLFGRLQRYVNEVKSDISREMELDELRRLQREVKGAASEIQRSVSSVATDFESGVRGVERQLNEAASAPPAPSATDDLTEEANALGPVEATPQDEPARQPSLPGLEKI
jgi:sec-independent protein translocase protein TatB